MITIGVDIGQTGAIAVYDNIFRLIIAVHDMPVMARLHGKGQQVDAAALASILMDAKAGKKAEVIIEAVSAMPGQGVSSTFRFGESFGVVIGVCGALQLPVRLVTPGQWKKRAGLTGKVKDAARAMAIQRHPEVSDRLARKKDCGRADAILIAEFGR